MRKTTQHRIDEKTLLIDTSELMSVLHCGRTSAVKIGIDAKSEIRVGKRQLWNYEKIKSYLDAISL